MRAIPRAVLPALLAALLAAARASALGKGEHPHPKFSLSNRDLEKLTSGLPVGDAELIRRNSRVFLEQLLHALEGPQDLLLLVDKEKGLTEDFEPADLVPLSRYPLTTGRKDLRLREALIPDLLSMTRTARESGIELVISSAHRSYSYQESLFQNDLATRGRAEVERDLARPGHSQHQLGTAIDFGSIDPSFAKTAPGRWLSENAWRFGFSLSYPEGQEQVSGYVYEPWHYRWVGRSAAALIRNFFSGSQQIFLAWYWEQRQYLVDHRQ